MDTVAFCLVRTGYEGVVINIYDEAGNEVRSVGVSTKQAKNWYYFDKPSEDAGICTYTIVATTRSDYSGKASDYRIMVGNNSDAERMMSGKENAVPVEMYYEEKMNFQSIPYMPNQYECWYKYKRGVYNTITVLSKSTNLRFKIIEADGDTSKPVYESNSYDHKTSFVGTWSSAEKVTDPKGTVSGKDYYLVVYNTRPNSATGLVQSNMLVAVGHPVMGAASKMVRPNTSVTINSSSFKGFDYTFIDSSIPYTAQLASIDLYGASGVRYWTVQRASGGYRSSSSYNTGIKWNFIKDSTRNDRLWGAKWRFEFKSGSSTKTIKPYFSISYYYEYGDGELIL